MAKAQYGYYFNQSQANPRKFTVSKVNLKDPDGEPENTYPIIIESSGTIQCGCPAGSRWSHSPGPKLSCKHAGWLQAGLVAEEAAKEKGQSWYLHEHYYNDTKSAFEARPKPMGE